MRTETWRPVCWRTRLMELSVSPQRPYSAASLARAWYSPLAMSYSGAIRLPGTAPDSFVALVGQRFKARRRRINQAVLYYLCIMQRRKTCCSRIRHGVKFCAAPSPRAALVSRAHHAALFPRRARQPARWLIPPRSGDANNRSPGRPRSAFRFCPGHALTAAGVPMSDTAWGCV
jgi:hypothetical protein